MTMMKNVEKTFINELIVVLLLYLDHPVHLVKELFTRRR